LGSALTNTSASGATLTQGAFATANFNVTVTGGFASTGALTRSITLGSSAISFGSWNALGATNLTLNANTSTITITGAAGTFNGGGLTYYNVTKTSSAAAALQIGDANNTFNAVSVTNTSGYGTLLFTGNQTIGTLTANGNALIAPNRIISSVIGTQVTLTVASFVTNGFINFRDINFAGAALPITVSTGGDLGNNSNITLATPKTIYWSLAAGGNWTATAWATTSGGAPATANFPLAQDTIIIENTGLNSGATITMNLGSFIGNMSMSTRTLPMTWAIGTQAVQNYGNLTLSSAVTITATTGSLSFLGFNKTQTITSAGVSFASSLTVNSPTLTVALAGALTTTATSTLTSGTLNINGQTLTTNLFASAGAIVRLIAFSGGTMAVLGATFTASGTNLTTSGSGTISMTSASSKTFAGGGFSYPTLNQGGAGALVITGANTFANMTNTVQPCTITFPASTTTTVSNFNVNGTAGNLVTLNSSAPGTQAILSRTSASVVSVNYLNIQDSNATPPFTWYAGTTSTDVSNNTGWGFSAPVDRYISIYTRRKNKRLIYMDL
jgi:fibronectin-binding autotransporter adhesin